MTDASYWSAISPRDEDAFEASMRRHGPMNAVGLQRVAGDHPQDAEDAFQATFLVLVRKAATIRPRSMVGNWLYGVAYRAALRSRTAAYRKNSREKTMSMPPEPVTMDESVWEDWLPLLDQELNALPQKYRLPIVLCDLQGKTRKEAAANLGWRKERSPVDWHAREMLAKLAPGVPGSARAATAASSVASAAVQT